MKIKIKHKKRNRRHKRVRAKIFGTTEKPRLCVFKSAKHIYAQLIDDENGNILAAANDSELKTKKEKITKKKSKVGEKEIKRSGKILLAYETGKLIAEKTLKKKIEKVVFDRGGYKYHGRVKALADGAREEGLIF
jgi:large subunit ribosomal protein L18